MLCDVCHKNIATVHLTEIVDDKIVEMHICQSCAQTKAEELKEHLSIPGFLGGLINQDREGKRKINLKCPACNLTYEEFKAKGKLGCERCYVIFKEQLLPLLKKIHSSLKHTGKAPVQIDQKVIVESRIEDLRKRLERAIQLEEYEDAAKLRDEIKKLLSRQKG
ncbi:MAG: UvrB/UvrC motif-containing protein [Candidatus Omnitrophica bacterium]|jgi:protein arginine kinase activator|nr:UvrB/UvrC motif-containing protein [Candidatus Omnitrophota bacterium]